MQSPSVRKNKDKNYEPTGDELSEDSYSSSSYVSESSRSNGYDPLQNLEEYMRMRDQL
jgi:hypothetical protein